jgi:DNA processing protein
MIDGIGCATFQELVATFRSASRALGDASRDGVRSRALAAADVALSHGARLGMAVIAAGDPDWPAGLSQLADVPPVLWALGNLDLLDDRPRVAIVGTRRATAYGLRVTRALAGAFANAGA